MYTIYAYFVVESFVLLVTVYSCVFLFTVINVKYQYTFYCNKVSIHFCTVCAFPPPLFLTGHWALNLARDNTPHVHRLHVMAVTDKYRHGDVVQAMSVNLPPIPK